MTATEPPLHWGPITPTKPLTRNSRSAATFVTSASLHPSSSARTSMSCPLIWVPFASFQRSRLTIAASRYSLPRFPTGPPVSAVDMPMTIGLSAAMTMGVWGFRVTAPFSSSVVSSLSSPHALAMKRSAINANRNVRVRERRNDCIMATSLSLLPYVDLVTAAKLASTDHDCMALSIDLEPIGPVTACQETFVVADMANLNSNSLEFDVDTCVSMP